MCDIQCVISSVRYPVCNFDCVMLSVWSGIVIVSVVDPNALNLDPDTDPGFWPNLDHPG